MDMIVFKSKSEVIVAPGKVGLQHLLNLYFVEGGRSIDDYDVYRASGADGISFSSTIKQEDMGGYIYVDLHKELDGTDMLEALGV